MFFNCACGGLRSAAAVIDQARRREQAVFVHSVGAVRIEVSARLLPGFFSHVAIFGNFARLLP